MPIAITVSPTNTGAREAAGGAFLSSLIANTIATSSAVPTT